MSAGCKDCQGWESCEAWCPSRGDIFNHVMGIKSGGKMQDCKVKALDVQEGGSHYKGKAIQPVEFIVANGIGFCEGNVVKYVTRWKDKGGVEDLKKARHYLDLLIELQ